MYLEKIEIFGFKSFADKTVINFSKPVTAIVGPNGCGKSNVVDAFRWVLGGPTAKALRSDKMIDVIFSGTEKRKPLNYAQISLTFTRIDKALSVNYQEICISRRLYRTGESEWLLNRNPVRLKDIHKLLWEAGLGKNAFYIFEQGKIDDLILATPHERRNIFEEAAKIMHFKEKRKESFRKLSQIEANLKRVEDIQVEVNKQIETLEKQAEEARIYKEQKEDLEKLSKELIISKWQSNHHKQTELSEKLKEKASAQETAKSTIQVLEEKVKALKETYHQRSEEAKKAYESFFEVKKSSELASFEYKAHQKKLQELGDKTASLKQSLQQFHQKHLQEHKIYLENQDQLSAYSKDLKSLGSQKENSLSEIQSLEAKVNNESEERKKSQNALLVSVNSENDLQLQLSAATSQLENVQERSQLLTDQEKRAQEELIENKKELSLLEFEFKKLQSTHAQSLQKQSELQSKISSQKEIVESSKEKLRLLSNEITSKEAKVSLLQKLKDEFDGYGKATKELLKHSKDSSHKLFDKLSPLSEWIIPQKGFEVSLSSLLEPYLQTLITKSQEDLEHVLEFAKSNNLKGFSILCLEHLKALPQKEDQKLAHSNLIANHFLHTISICNSLPEKFAPSSLVGSEFFIDSMGVYHHLSEEKNNLFLRETELRELDKDLITLISQKDAAETTFNEASGHLSQFNEEYDSLSTEIQKLNISLKENEVQLASVTKKIEHLSTSTEGITSQRRSLKDSLEKLQKETQEIASKHQKEKDHRIKLKSHFEKIEQEFDKNFQSLSEKRSLRAALENQIQEMEKEAQKLNENIKVFESKSSDFEEQIQSMNQTIEENDQSYQKLSSESQGYIEQEKKFAQKLAQADKHYHSFEDALEQLEAEDKKLSEDLANCRKELEENQKSDLEINNKHSELSAENNLYFSEIQERYELEVDQVNSFQVESTFSITKMEKEVRRLKRSLDGFTEINLKAMADCKEKKERFTFLSSQIEDLEASKNKLVEIITELDDTSRKMFSDTFENIRKHFKENYTLLFNGGEADLELNSDEDILEAGIEIIAQPPGKKMRSIQQMSGGEKCLTALALLFALFETQSIPFCILDEVDAPLDDTNIERFTRVLKQFVKKHQFIIITHNKRTMAMADILLGISMQEKGVTKVIPLEFEKQTASEQESEALV